MNAPRSVESTPYHVWTDALHARALARYASNDWDRGTYVRWAIISACSAFEVTASEILSSKIGRRVKDNITHAISARGLPALDWGSGVWQRVLEVYQLRVDYVHRHIPQPRLFALVDEANLAIDTMRAALKDLCRVVSATNQPNWLDADDDPNVTQGAMRTGISVSAHLTVTRAGANPDDPNTVRVGYVYGGKEYDCYVLPPGSDHLPLMEEIEKSVQVPITAIRAYRGKDLLAERKLTMRGG